MKIVIIIVGVEWIEGITVSHVCNIGYRMEEAMVMRLNASPGLNWEKN